MKKSTEQKVVEQIAKALQEAEVHYMLQSIVGSIGDTLTFEEALVELRGYNKMGKKNDRST